MIGQELGSALLISLLNSLIDCLFIYAYCIEQAKLHFREETLLPNLGCPSNIKKTKADKLDPERPSERGEFPEGELKEKLHLSRERNRELVRQAKLLGRDQDGRLKCACCYFDFFATYGEVGKDFIEAHHTKPVSTLLENGEETKIEDLALVCSNCHSMLHRKRPWLEMDELSKLIC